MTIASDKSSIVEGQWNIRWSPEAAPATEGVLSLAADGSLLRVKLDTPIGSGSGEGTIDGTRLSWSITLGESPVPLRFNARIDGDEISGSVVAGFGPFGDSSLEGTRVGSNVQIRSREGSEALAESLIKCGIEYVFGYHGGVSGSAHRSIIGHEIPNLAGRTELSATWMSYGYNRVKRRAASASLVWCVGAMHASPVVHAAKLDSTPLLFMPVEHSTAWDMRDILQDSTELYSALKPLSKYIKRIVDPGDIPLAVRQAVTAASTGKFGPSVLLLPHTTMLGRTSIKAEELFLPSPPASSQSDVSKTLEVIKKAHNPILLAGAGVHLSNAEAELRAFAEATGVPVITSGPGGRGVLPDDHPLYAGDLANWGGFPLGSKFASAADLWVAVGFSFSQTATSSWTVPKPNKIIHVDIDEKQIGRIFQPSLGIVADAKVFLGQINDALTESGWKNVDYRSSSRVAEIRKSKDEYFKAWAAHVGKDPIMPIGIGQVLAQEVPPETLLVGDEGFMVPGMAFTSEKYPSGFAAALGFHYCSLGSTLPVAIGAKLADPGRTVISWGGDAGFFYDCMDLSFLAEHNLKVIVIINNNGGLYGGRRARALMPRGMGGPAGPWTDLPDSDFAAVAKGFGIPAERVLRFDGLVPALRRALAATGPYLLDVETAGSNLSGLMSTVGSFMAPKFGHGDKYVEGSWPS